VRARPRFGADERLPEVTANDGTRRAPAGVGGR